MRTGTNGLDADLTKDDEVWFSEPDLGEDSSGYDMLVIWVKVINWQSNKDIDVAFYSLGSPDGWSDYLHLGDYIDSDTVGVWQRAVIPLNYFNIINRDRVKILELVSDGNIHIYLDDIAFGLGYPVPIREYSMNGDEVGKIVISGKESDLIKIPRPQAEFIGIGLPGLSVDEMKPEINRNIYLRPGLRPVPRP
jgi:hypothetical protein